MARKKKVMTEEERQRRSKAMLAVYARKRAKKAKVREKRAYKRKDIIPAIYTNATARTIPNDEGRAEWKDADPLEVQLKDAHATIDRLRGKMNQYGAFREVMTSLKSSMQGMINIINSTNVIIDND